MAEAAYLSARVSRAKKQAIRRIAATQGITVQELVNRLVDEFVAKADRRPPMRIHLTVYPPSSVRHCPVMNAAASEAR